MWHLRTIHPDNLNDWNTWALILGVAVFFGCATAVFTVCVTRARRQRSRESALRRREMAAEVINWLPPAPDAEGRRKSIRRAGTVVPVLVAERRPNSRPSKGFVLDRSRGGLRVALGRPHQPGSVINVKPAGLSEPSVWTKVEVRSCRQSGDFYELGCQFVDTPPWHVLLTFG